MEVYGYIYKVTNKANGKIYIGLTTTGFDIRYAYDILQNTHNEHLRNAIKKYGIDSFDINKKFDTAYSKEELDALEDMYIKIYDTINPKYGYNKKYGGGNGKHTEETKNKISLSVSGENNPFFGKHHTEETKNKLREANKGNKYWEGKSHSEEAKIKISNSKRGTQVGGNNPRARKVICLNTKEVFDCAKDAAIWSGRVNVVNAGSPIIACCNGRRKSSGKHPLTNERLQWMYYEEWLKL